MSWQECAAEHCHSDSSPDGRYCAACADQMVATGRPMQLAWRLLKDDPRGQQMADMWSQIQSDDEQSRMQRVSSDRCQEIENGIRCNKPAAGVDGTSERAMRLCEAHLQASLVSYENVMRQAMGLPPRGEE